MTKKRTKDSQTRARSQRHNVEVRNRAFHVLARMRRTGDSLSAASREEHIDPRTVRKYLGADLKGLGEGQTKPTRADSRRRNMLVLTSGGTTPAIIRGSEQASKLGRYMSAVGQYLRTGSSHALEEFEGQSIGGHPLITDTRTLNYLAEAGSLQLDRIYAEPEASS